MDASGIVTLTTDFGAGGAYAGALRGSVLRAARVMVVDVTHDVPPHDVAEGARIIASACPVFPPGTVHVGVVDPGVGTDRAGVVVAAGDHLFVGPDNGLFGDVARRLGLLGAWAIEGARPASATFHGRDVFAPVAARLAAGLSPERVGRPIAALVPRVAPAIERGGRSVRGEIVAVDHFGNLVTNLHEADLPPGPLVVTAPGVTIRGLTTTYGAASTDVIALFGSDGFLEIATPNDSAARRLGLGRGAVVEVSSS